MHRSISFIDSSSSFARTLAGVLVLAGFVGTAACSGAEDSTGKDESSALSGSSKDSATAKDPNGKPPAPAPTGTTPPIYESEYQLLVGAWVVKGNEGPVRYAVFYDEDQKPLGHSFFADLITPPTVSSKNVTVNRATGTFDVTKDFIELQSNSPLVNGSYRYQFDGANSVSVAEPAGIVTYERIPTYCDTKTDCEGQVYPHLECLGAPTCGAHVCGWSCGDGDPTK